MTGGSARHFTYNGGRLLATIVNDNRGVPALWRASFLIALAAGDG